MKPRKFTIKTATETWVETTRAIEGLKPLQAEAAKFLLETAEKTGRRTFADLIAVVATGGGRVLDQAAVKAELGERISDDRFWKLSKSGRTLKLLK